jgi:hypothetical protein
VARVYGVAVIGRISLLSTSQQGYLSGVLAHLEGRCQACRIPTENRDGLGIDRALLRR